MHPKYRVEAVAAGIDAFLLKGTSTGALLDIILAQRPDLSGQPSKTQGAK
jgi:hypothetical protein